MAKAPAPLTGPILDHIGLSVTDYAKAVAFYRAALAPLGIGMVVELAAAATGGTAFAGFGRFGGTKGELWIEAGPRQQPRLHLAFAAATRAEVDAFYRAGLAAGGADNGAPGVRAHYHEHYYGAFVLDPDGNNVEAVCHAAP